MGNSRRIIFVFALFLVIALARQFLPTQTRTVNVSEQSAPYATDSSRQEILIEGRYKSFRASLGLPPLPSTITVASPFPPRAIARAARFDLKRKRAIEESSSSGRSAHVQLHFSPDALEEPPNMSLEALAESFRAVAVFEKEAADERVRERLQREGQVRGRRPLS